MREACQLSFYFSLSFVLFYFGAPPNPPPSGCPVNMCKYNIELSSKGRNTKVTLRGNKENTAVGLATCDDGQHQCP